jgi:hypothetical protein
MCDEFWAVETPPSVTLHEPKFQFQLVGLLVDVSLNMTVSGAVPLIGEPMNPETTAGELESVTLMYPT